MSANAKQHWQPRLVCSRPVACGLVLVSSFKKKEGTQASGKRKCTINISDGYSS